MEIRIRMMEMKMSISIRVKPARPPLPVRRRYSPRQPAPVSMRGLSIALPLIVPRPVESNPSTSCVDVKHVLPVPGAGIRRILPAPQAPIGGVSHRIRGDAAEKANAAVGLARQRHPIDQRPQRGRIALGVGFDSNQLKVWGVRWG